MLRKVWDFLVHNVPSFTYLNITQFLGALNDNIYKLLIVYFLIQMDGVENSPVILALTGAIFVLPFLLFSAISGGLADRFSKSSIIVLTKILEVVTMSLGLLGFVFKLKIGSYVILFLMATQSAIFGPCKYGILPEIVPNEKISRANGVMSSFTYLAIILGTFLASFVTQITDYNFVLSAMVCVAIAIFGLATSFFIEYTPPADTSKRITLRIISEIYRTLKRIWTEVPAPMVLLTVISGSSYFLFLGAFMQLNLIPFAVQILGMTDVQGGYLFLCTALGIGLGSYLAGRLSGTSIELGLVPVSGACLAAGCFFLDAFSEHPMMVFPLVALLGIAGGLFLVPLDSCIQVLSPSHIRGQVVAATNFLSFLGVLFASGVLFFINLLGYTPDTGFTIVGFLTLFYVGFLCYQFFDFFTRFFCMVLSKMHFTTTYIGKEIVPEDTPVIYVCHHTAWNDTLLLLGAQDKRIRFFIQEEQAHSPFMKKLYQLLRIVRLPSIEPLENNPDCLTRIKETLKRGISVCIFVNHTDIEGKIEHLKYSYSFQDIVEELSPHIIPVTIDKQEKPVPNHGFLRKIKAKMHWPAKICFGKVAME